MKLQALYASLFAIASCAGAAHAATPACASARIQVEVSHIQRVQACTSQGPNSPICRQNEQVEKLQWQMMDAVCPAPAPQCAVQRQLYDIVSQQRAIKCQQAGSSTAPVCQAAMQQEDVSFLQVKLSCFMQ
ncbi:hypothetical protein [Lysobacter sp. Root690]|uniref:hypothetical protein n=1 Tax=Lysobacter sp. Root690 TaxID=1736588 RepID=UPI0006F2E99A|nr:hypothetical protein [Lysobacter sp. Root690]KRB06694.1 hypothetical protein ASD86_11760 [Lysobacter sp. Root690]